MTITSRFRPVGWVAAVAIAALGCYLVSLRVATKRGEVANVEAQILATREDMRRLETELGTRGRLVQLERWNAQVLSLTAPRAGQYLTSAVQLASLGAMPAVSAGAGGTPGDGAVLQASYAPPASAQTRIARPAAPTAPTVTPAPARARVVLASASDNDGPPLLRHTNYLKIGADRAPKLRQVAMLDGDALGAIERAVREESGEAKKTRP